MEKLHYDIAINATPEKVWKVLWTDQTYREWTSAFSEGSHAKTDWKEGSKCVIGPSATVSDLKNSAVIQNAFPAFDQYAKLISSTPIRNMATIAGNFINASPIGDFTIFFLALDAQICLTDGKIKRELPLRKLYKGYKTLDKKPQEYIEQIWFELPGKNTLFHFEKVSKRTHLDIASVNSAISDGFTEKTFAATCRILVFTPCPISTAPVLMPMLPSVYT